MFTSFFSTYNPVYIESLFEPLELSYEENDDDDDPIINWNDYFSRFQLTLPTMLDLNDNRMYDFEINPEITKQKKQTTEPSTKTEKNPITYKRQEVLDTVVNVPSNPLLTRDFIVNYAKPYFGTGYSLRGPRKLGKPIDCSGWTQAFYFNNFGIDVGRTTVQQRKCGTEIKSLKDALPGDLIIFRGGGPNKMHVGIYIGDGLMVDSTTSKAKISKTGSGIGIRKVYNQIITIRRPNLNAPKVAKKSKRGGVLVPKVRYIK